MSWLSKLFKKNEWLAPVALLAAPFVAPLAIGAVGAAAGAAGAGAAAVGLQGALGGVGAALSGAAGAVATGVLGVTGAIGTAEGALAGAATTGAGGVVNAVKTLGGIQTAVQATKNLVSGGYEEVPPPVTYYAPQNYDIILSPGYAPFSPGYAQSNSFLNVPAGQVDTGYYASRGYNSGNYAYADSPDRFVNPRIGNQVFGLLTQGPFADESYRSTNGFGWLS